MSGHFERGVFFIFGKEMNTIATVLHELVGQYQARGLNNGGGLLPPADTSSISKTEQMLGFSLPESLRMVYGVFGGQEYIAPGITGVFGSHRLHSPSEAAATYDMFQKAEKFPGNDFPPEDSLPGPDWSRWHPALIPFASWDAYNLVICRHTNRIYEFEPYSGLSERKFETMQSLLAAVLEAARTSAEPSLDFITTE